MASQNTVAKHRLREQNTVYANTQPFRKFITLFCYAWLQNSANGGISAVKLFCEAWP